MSLSTLLLSPPILLLCPSLSLASFGVAASLPIRPHLPPFPLTPVGPSFPPHLEYFSKGNSQPEGYTEDEHYKMNEVDPYSASSQPYKSGDNEQDYYFFDNKQDDYPTHGDTGVLFNEAVEYEDDYLDRFSPEVVEDVVDLSNHIGPLGNILVTGALVFVLSSLFTSHLNLGTTANNSSVPWGLWALPSTLEDLGVPSLPEVPGLGRRRRAAEVVGW